jgi:hypothetical protein
MVTQEAIHQSLLSDGSMISEKKLKYFYIGSYLKTMSCYGGHLGFPIDKQNVFVTPSGQKSSAVSIYLMDTYL